MRRLLVKAVIFSALLAAIVLAGVRYYWFVTEMIFRESAGHLIEIYRQVNQSLNNLVSRNWRTMRMWAPYLHDVADEDRVKAYVRDMQEQIGFTEFYFLSREGEYRTAEGEKGYLLLQESLPRLFLEGEEIVANSVQAGESEIMVFAIPCEQGTCFGLQYEAIAISFNNRDIVAALEISAFDGASKSYVIYPDGRVLIDNTGEQNRSVYNFFGMLSDRSDMDADGIEELERAIQTEHTGVRTVQIDQRDCYLVYQNVDFGKWSVVGLAPTEVVNANMNRLQSTTVLVVVGIVASLFVGLLIAMVHSSREHLRAKDVEILYREELFSTLSANVDDIFLMLDGNNLHVDYISPNVEKLMGVPEREVRLNARALEWAQGGGGDAQVLQLMAKMLPGQQGEWEREFVHRRTGEVRWFRITVLCRVLQREKKYIIVLSDRSKEKAINLELKEAVDTANRANSAKSVFLSSISHDIRTPMNAIIGFATLAAARAGDKERVREYLGKILSSAEHLLNLINEVLDMSSIESGKMRLEETEVNLTDVLHEVKSIIGGQVCAKKLELFMEIADGVHEDVLCDRLRMKQLLLNLLSNAIKFTPPHGVVSAGIAQLNGRSGDKGLYEIRVKDNGVGMNEQFVARVFDPFEREQTSTVSGIQGTGLGMAISKNIVNMMGGEIRVDTKPGVGTEFIIRIPLRQSESVREPERIPDLTGSGALVVNSRPAEGRIIARMLNQLGMNAERAESGAQAEAVAKQAEADGTACRVCIVDRRLNDTDGIETVRRLARTFRGCAPIFILTAYDWSDVETEARDAGVFGFCSKPVFQSDLQNVLLEALNQRKVTVENVLPLQDQVDFKGRKILLAEDNELSREIAREILESYGFLIDTAADGQEAVQKVVQGGYDLILMDVQMPVMDGYEATRRIRALENSAVARTPIFALTANAFVEDRNEAMQKGMDGFVSKPIDIRALIETMKELFG